MKFPPSLKLAELLLILALMKLMVHILSLYLLSKGVYKSKGVYLPLGADELSLFL